MRPRLRQLELFHLPSDNRQLVRRVVLSEGQRIDRAPSGFLGPRPARLQVRLDPSPRFVGCLVVWTPPLLLGGVERSRLQGFRRSTVSAHPPCHALQDPYFHRLCTSACQQSPAVHKLCRRHFVPHEQLSKQDNLTGDSHTALQSIGKVQSYLAASAPACFYVGPGVPATAGYISGNRSCLAEQ